MNLNALTTRMMLNLTARWLNHPMFKAALEAVGPLGVGILLQLAKAHDPLSLVQNNRAQVQGLQRTLIDLAAGLDRLHDSKARALHLLLRGLIEATEDEAKATEYRALLDLLFPIGLAVTKLPYIEVGGAAVALERAVTAEIRAKLAAIQVGEHRMIDLFDAWMKAGHQLGQLAQERAELAAASVRDGSNGEWGDVKAGRSQWIRAVRGLLWTLDVEPALADVREKVVAGLRRAIATAQRGAGRGAATNGDEQGLDEAGEFEEADGLEEVEIDEAAANVDIEDDEFGVDTVTPNEGT